MLRALATDGGAVTVTVLADQLGQHPNTVREHLDALVADGCATRTRSAPSGRGRPAWLYRAAESASQSAGGWDVLAGDGQFASDGQEYVALALALIDQVSDSSPDPRGLARRAGERWGRTLAAHRRSDRRNDARDGLGGGRVPASTGDGTPVAPIGEVLDLLRDLRFEPHPAPENGDTKTVRLTTCPFLDAARRHPDVVCQIHLGIVRGAVQSLGGDPDAADLTAFAEPGACLLTLPQVR